MASFYSPLGDIQCLVITGDGNQFAYVKQTTGINGGWTITYLPNISAIKEVVAATQDEKLIAVFQDGNIGYYAIYDFTADLWEITANIPFIKDGLKLTANGDKTEGTFYGLANTGKWYGIQLLVFDSGSNMVIIYHDSSVQPASKNFTPAVNYLLQYDFKQYSDAYVHYA